MSGLSGEPPDDLDRELRELQAGLAKPARFKEPSAAERARMAARPVRQRAARKARKLTQPSVEPPRQPAGGWSPPPRRSSGTAAVFRANRAFFIGLGIFVVLSVAFWTYGVPSFTHRDDQTPVTSGPKPLSPPSATVAAPFLGTPAQSYADGAAGIVIPPAQPVGSYTAAQVAAAYQTTKQMLVAAHLDGPTLAGGAPDSFASMLIPQQRTQFVSGLDKTGLDSGGYQNSTRAWVTSFAPGTELVGDVIKVHGTMQAGTSTNGSYPVLQIHADYLFVYPVERPRDPSTLMRIVDRDVVDVDFGAYAGPGSALQPWWQVVGSLNAGARCDVNDGYLHPEFPNGPPDKVKPKGIPVNPYDQSTPAPSNAICRATTGT
jgi:hypothetical protein